MQHMCWSINQSFLLSIQAALLLLKGNRPIWKIRLWPWARTCPWSSLSLGAHHWIWTLVPIVFFPTFLLKQAAMEARRVVSWHAGPRKPTVSSQARFWEDHTLASSLVEAPSRGKGHDSSRPCHQSYTPAAVQPGQNHPSLHTEVSGPRVLYWAWGLRPWPTATAAPASNLLS